MIIYEDEYEEINLLRGGQSRSDTWPSVLLTRKECKIQLFFSRQYFSYLQVIEF